MLRVIVLAESSFGEGELRALLLWLLRTARPRGCTLWSICRCGWGGRDQATPRASKPRASRPRASRPRASRPLQTALSIHVKLR